MTPAGTSNELDVQNGWEENTHAFVEAAALLSIALRYYAGAPIATYTHVFFFFIFYFVYLEIPLFPSIFCTISALSLYGENAITRSFLPNGVFLPCDHGLEF